MLTITALNADQNQLRSLDLRHLLSAEEVSARANRVRRVSLPPGDLCALRRLALADNDLRAVGDVGGDVEGVWTSVEWVGLEGNRVCEVPGFREQMRERFPSLKMLNGEAI